ncbi:hypothetical protein Dda_8627 [Drechslerella dactyloides]|uniref:Pre-mRNA splicing factor n=1 Tax=Drechslerella dactyloides TaxID=74499 RepID=A0AAD6IQP5_DREDA|nr:hypothetical protein Dda_8627 [Drechslerella dactyloides]
MAALVDYGSSDDESPAAIGPSGPPGLSVTAAPDVSLDDPMTSQLAIVKPTDKSMSYNATYADLYKPAAGPANPFKSNDGSLKRKNVPTGYAEETLISDATFTTHHRTFTSLGYAADPSNPANMVGDQANAAAFGGRNTIEYRPSKEESREIKRRRQKRGDSSVVDGPGQYLGPWASYKNASDSSDDEAAGAEDVEYEEEAAAPASNPIIDKAGAEYLNVNTTGVEQTTFHGSQERDYLGRTYMHVPQDLDINLGKEVGSTANYIPKKLVHTWRGHTKPVTAVRFFPHSGHLILSSSADAKIKLWDVYHDREMLRTFDGHTKSVNDITFTNTGDRFLSASYDRQMKLWDTETGQCINRFSTGKIPHVIRFNPDPAKHHEFIAGMSDKKIVQFDTRTAAVVQEYDHHLGPVNTLTFVDDNRRFISTSDDKSLRAWEYGIPVPIKFIAEPYMYSMVRAALHPNGKYVALQSADNQVVVYATTERFRQNRKKSFRGHNNAGYAIDVDVSPDGQFLMSGDSDGWVCFWDWKTCKMYHKIRASETAVTCAAWHPQEGSKVAVAGLDGGIRYYD